MNFGIDALGAQVDAGAAVPGGEYRCPACRGRLVMSFLRGRPYFRHLNQCGCSGPWDGDPACRTGGMSVWHLDWQRRFAACCREIQISSGGADHWTDVRLGNLALEFQHSGITEREWRERTSFYLDQCELVPFWVYDRTGRDFESDRALLTKREFRRNALGIGPDWPVALDYGAYAVLAWDFDMVPGWDMFRPLHNAVIDRAELVRFLSDLSAYPYGLLRDMDAGRFAGEHAVRYGFPEAARQD